MQQIAEQQKELTEEAIQRLHQAIADNKELKLRNKEQEKQIGGMKLRQEKLAYELVVYTSLAQKLNSDLFAMTRHYQLVYEQLEQTKALYFSLNDAQIYVKTFQAKYNQACAELSKLTIKYKAQQQFNERLQQQYNDYIMNLSTQVYALEETLVLTQRKHDNIAVLLKEREIVFKRLEFECQQAANQLYISIYQTADKQKELDDAKAASDARCDELAKQIGEKDAEIEKLRQQLAEQGQNLDNMGAQYEKMRKQRDQAEAAVKQPEEQQGEVQISGSDEGSDGDESPQKSIKSDSKANEYGTGGDYQGDIAISEENSGTEESNPGETAAKIEDDKPKYISGNGAASRPFSLQFEDAIQYVAQYAMNTDYYRVQYIFIPRRVISREFDGIRFNLGENAPASYPSAPNQDSSFNNQVNQSVVYLSAQPADKMRRLESTSSSPEVEEIGLQNHPVVKNQNALGEQEASESHYDSPVKYPAAYNAAAGAKGGVLQQDGAPTRQEDGSDQQRTLYDLQYAPEVRPYARMKPKLFGKKAKTREDAQENKQADELAESSVSYSDKKKSRLLFKGSAKKDKKQASAEVQEVSVTAGQLFSPQGQPKDEPPAESADSASRSSSAEKRKFSFGLKKKYQQQAPETLENNVDLEKSESQSQSKTDTPKRRKNSIFEKEIMDTPVLRIEDQGLTRKEKKLYKIDPSAPAPVKLLPSQSVQK